ncbi:MAG: hypothetical protein P1U44_09700 [Vicingaceae bacterium]|nr:hypothetical protein [Vicingaceae bacterium]
MLVKIVTKKRFKVIAIFLAVNLLAQIGFPTVAFALTSGPSQPEMGSFEPVNTNQMVDLFSGDFTYNIPLMNVPGPNGGYPINLAYHAGIGMEQEASWVGLGWNINPGAINRNLRGVPDDFSGDKIKKTLHMKPQRKLSLGIKSELDLEVFGVDVNKGLFTVGGSASATLYYDNYKGVGSILGASLSISELGQKSEFMNGLEGSLSLTSDSKEGLGVSPSLSYARAIKDMGHGFETGLSFNSRQGVSSITFKSSLTNLKTSESGVAGTSFAHSTYVPGNEMPRFGFGINVEIELGIDGFGSDVNPLKLDVGYSQSGILHNTIDMNSYGYLYAEDEDETSSLIEPTKLSDFNREKDIPVNKNSKALPIPSATYDVFTIKGQGVGGVFRTYRSDIGVFKDPIISSAYAGFGIGLEAAAGAGVKVGANPKFSVTESYSGPWKNHHESVTSVYKFKDKVTNELFEPSYFKAMGELIPSASMNGGQNSSEEPFRFDIGKTYKFPFSMVPVARNYLRINNDLPQQFSGEAITTSRQKRVQSIEYLTKAEKNGSYYSSNIVNQTYPTSNYTAVTAPSTSAENHHIGEISVVNPDGNRYVYDLPAYNISHQDVTFSVGGSGVTSGRLKKYSENVDNSSSNSEGLMNLFSKTEMPAYAHSYLLTAVLSPDYVDLTGNGPTEDDLGYWVKFNYIKRTSFSWRAPYGVSYPHANYPQGNNIENKLSNDMDDMSGYSYGEKEIMYLQSIETKTHVAEYHLIERLDGLGSAGVNGGQDNTQKLLALDKIVLKSKENETPIKTVHFDYDYTLCNNIPNHTSFNGTSGPGKLTLKKVWFTHFNNEAKGELSPYQFTYDYDPNYNIAEIDRWGNYHSEGPFNNVSVNHLYPYVNQTDSTTRANEASAWNLTKVTMPSGGELNIVYESDDYAYVQNKKAMQMFKIIGTGETTLNTSAPLSNDDDRIYIELDKSVDITELAKYVSGVDEIYFKTYMKLKNYHETSNPAYDYVEGYAKFQGNYGLHQPDIYGKSNQAWIQVINVPPHQLIQSTVNPIKMAGLREIRFNRSDLLSGQNTGLGAVTSIASIVSVVPLVLTTIMDAMQMITGFYNYGIMLGWCNQISITNNYPSYLRLNNPNGKKFGGGCRVKSIELYDGWKEMIGSNYQSSAYGQVYSYVLEDGITSSGVAEYEPLIGGEENPFRRPLRYSSDRMLIKDNALMIEEPFNESLFPSANVGYSRVVVKNKTEFNDVENTNRKALRGITVHEFYTARDFPVYTKHTDVDYEPYNTTIFIPFIGVKTYQNNGYSQGYSIELNNMHGKPYGVATYASTVDESDPQPGEHGVEPVASTYYYYKTKEPFVRYKPSGNKLDNQVNVLTGDAVVSPTEIGKHVDTYVDMRENSTRTKVLGGLPNTNGGFLYIVPMLMLLIDESSSMFRSVVTNKVITKNGILDSQVTFKEGARVTQQNVYYDRETGSPLLTTTTNDFDKPVYDYTYAAHWEHEGMKGAYNNVGALIDHNSTAIAPGMVLLHLLDNSSAPIIPPKKYWVEASGVRDANGTATSLPTGTFKIIKSNYNNQQTVPMGKIISLTNPVTEREFPMFTAINNFNIGALPDPVPTDYTLIGDLGFTDCLNNKVYDGIIVTISADNELTINSDASYNKICGGGETNEAFIVFDPSVDLTSPSSFDVTTMVLTKHGATLVKAVDDNGSENGNVIWGELINAECLNECLDGVLHASATKYSSSWNINYVDAGVVYPTGHPNVGTTPPSNTVRYGAESIWRTDKNYVFNIDRKQTPSATQTGIDGTYQSFGLFSWDPLAPLDKWVKANQINQYSPYGFELENQDALGIKSAALYGYSNSLVTAVASNTEYRELVFDGFEDYGSYSYSNPSSNYGHFQLDAATITTNEAHTGKASVAILDNNNIEFSNSITTPIAGKFWPKASTTYYFSAWVKVADNSTTATLTVDATPITSTSPHNQKIEGWQRLEGKFTTGASTIDISVSATGGTVYIDDIRIQPFKSAMKTFVYDPTTLWLKAELDERNYATFYNYDEEGNRVQVKKETKDGIRTIISNRKNTKQTQ